MYKKMVLAALLLVSVAAAVSGTDFEERITEKKWYRDYFNEVIYRRISTLSYRRRKHNLL